MKLILKSLKKGIHFIQIILGIISCYSIFFIVLLFKYGRTIKINSHLVVVIYQPYSWVIGAYIWYHFCTFDYKIHVHNYPYQCNNLGCRMLARHKCNIALSNQCYIPLSILTELFFSIWINNVAFIFDEPFNNYKFQFIGRTKKLNSSN